MHIGIDIRTLMDPLTSGVPEYTFNLLTELFRLDKKNQYTLFYNSWRSLDAIMPKFVGNNINTVATRYPNKIFNNIMQTALKRPKLDRLTKVDLFFMPNISFAALSKGCRKVITIHDLSYLRHPEYFSKKRRAWHRLINVRRLVSEFDLVIAVSENTKRDIIELCGVPDEKIAVIYHGISQNFRKIDDQEPVLKNTKKKYALPEKFILYLGTLEPRKNVVGIIKAYEQFYIENKWTKEYQLVVAGGQGWKYKEIFDVWERSPQKNNIRFIGFIEKTDKVYLYNLATIFVYPSFYEGFGFPPLEAMACGCPTIISTSSSLPEITRGAALAINPYNVSELTQAITEVAGNLSLARGLSLAGRTVANQYSWPLAARTYLRHFVN